MGAAATASERGRTVSIGEALAQLGVGRMGAKPAGTRRTGQPVRRNSYYANDKRASGLWTRLGANNREARRIIAHRLQAARLYDLKHKQPGKWNGPLGAIGLEVLAELYRRVDYKTGQLDPAIATICQALKRSKQAVINALKRLKEHGFLDWVRRCEPTENGGAGPQIRQISNAYGFNLPHCAAAWVRGKLSAAPPPDDDVTRRAIAAAEADAMIASLPMDEQARTLVDNPQLAEVLARMGASLEKSSASLPNMQKPASEE